MDNIALGRRYFGDRLIGNESYSFEEAGAAVGAGELAAVSFGRHFIANPDSGRAMAVRHGTGSFRSSTRCTQQVPRAIAATLESGA